jgi:hypothetical protein
MPMILLAQVNRPDTVVVELARTSKLVFTMQDSNDLFQLKHYDFQALFEDILDKLENENQDTSSAIPAEEKWSKDTEDEEDDEEVTERPSYKDYEDEDDDDEDENNDGMDNDDFWTPHYPSSRQFFNMDFGINNYAEDPNSPDIGQPYYTVHPWGSWTIALNAVNRTRFSDKFSLESSLGVSWYNFKFEADNTHIEQTPTGVAFIPDPRPLYFKKSKLTASYINVSLIPVFNTGREDNDWRHWRHWNQSAFRIGLGPYVGYRLGSHSKQTYEIDGDKQVQKDHDDFYLENLRYGLRLQIGVHGADFFISYDLNSLFHEGDGPELHPFSFGFTF